MSRDDYLYATGVIRSLEHRLLDRVDIERMVDAPDAESAFKVFHDTDFGAHVGDRHFTEYNDALKENLQRVTEDIRGMTNNEDLKLFLLGKRDLHNLKVLWKEKLGESSSEEIVNELGVEPNVDRMREALESGVPKGVHPEIEKWIARSLREISENTPGEDIDFILDRIYLQSKRETAKRLGIPFLTDLVHLQEDNFHLKTFVRAKALGRDKKWFTEHILTDSAPYTTTFVNAFDKELGDALENIRLDISPLLRDALDHFKTNQNLSDFEKDAENAEIEYLRSAKLIAFGPEVIVAYYHAKRNAIRNVRLIMTGKIANVPPEELKKRVRNTY